MATIMGKSGYVYVPMGVASASAGTIIPTIDTWSLAGTGDAIETTGFGTTTAVIFKSFDAGLKSLTGNVAGTMDGTDGALSVLMTTLFNSATTSVNCVLHMDANHHVSVASIITGWTINSTATDKVTFGFDFTCSDAPVYA